MNRELLEVFAAGLRIGAKSPTILTDDLFTGDRHDIFSGDAANRTESLLDWLKDFGVEWDGKSDSLIQTVADALKSSNELESARAILNKAMLQLKYANITGPKLLADVIAALKSVKETNEENADQAKATT